MLPKFFGSDPRAWMEWIWMQYMAVPFGSEPLEAIFCGGVFDQTLKALF
jgi:hypothetical protein